jgi:hypothetical protein
VDSRCRTFVRAHRFLRAGDVADASEADASPAYRFAHALYRQVIYESISKAGRQRLHRAVGSALESLYVGRTTDVAPELAVHFERGADITARSRTSRRRRVAPSSGGPAARRSRIANAR